MKIKMILRSVITAAALFAGAQLASAQYYAFNIPEIAGGTHLDHPVSAYGTVDFEFGTIEVFVTNDSSVASRITGIWFLKPVSGDVVLTPENPADAPAVWASSNEIDNSVYNIIKNEVALPEQPKENNPNKFEPDYAAYFGATSASSTGIWSDPSVPEYEALAFSFTLAADFSGVNWSDYASAGFPHVIVRYQSVEAPIGSSAAWGGFIIPEDDTPIVPVPEPSHIAVLALAGLGGFILIRRRLVRKG